MPKKYKNIYGLRIFTPYGTGIQYVKGDTLKQAKERFKKKYPKKSIINSFKKTPEMKIFGPAI